MFMSRSATKKFKSLFAALPAVFLLAGTGASHAVVATTDPSNWILSPGQNVSGTGAGAFDGVAKLLFTAASDGGGYVCSGSLLSGGMYVLTAAHCADDFTTMTVDFKFGAVTANVTQAIVNPTSTARAPTCGTRTMASTPPRPPTRCSTTPSSVPAPAAISSARPMSSTSTAAAARTTR